MKIFSDCRPLASIPVLMLACFFTVTDFSPRQSEARTNNNWSSVNRSQQCSREAERYADRRARRQTAGGAIGGAAVGGIAGNSRRNAGIGAAIGAGAGLFRANSRWRTYYNRAYFRCINR